MRTMLFLFLICSCCALPGRAQTVRDSESISLYGERKLFLAHPDLCQGRRVIVKASDILSLDDEQQNVANEQINSLVQKAGDVYLELNVFALEKSAAEHPEFYETDVFGNEFSATGKTYASPFNMQWRQRLLRIVGDLGKKYPSIKGIMLDCSLPLGEPLLAYSESSIAASEESTGIDPLQLNLGGNTSELQVARRWIEWRLSSVADLVNDLSTAYHRGNPKAQVMITGFARWSQLKEGKRNTTLEDWPRWLTNSPIDEIVLQDRWGEVDKRSYDRAVGEVKKANQAVEVTVLLSLKKVRTPDDLRATLQVLSGRPGKWLVELDQVSDLERVPSVLVSIAAQELADNRTLPLPAPIEPTDVAAALPLAVGKPAPDFSVADMNGRLWRLSDLKGKKNLLLTFFPKCFTGGCEKHLESIEQQRDAFDDRETQILAVSVDTPDVQVRFANSIGLSFPLIPDPQRNLCSLYGATQNSQELARRMSVFIDKNGVVKWIDEDVNVTTHGVDALRRIEIEN